jgi:hypothetical protein
MLYTEGYKKAIDYVVEEMRKIGIELLGDDSEGSYTQMIRKSVHPAQGSDQIY